LGETVTLRKAFWRAAILAFLLLAGLFAIKFTIDEAAVSPPGAGWLNASASFDTGRKNYATEKLSAGLIAAGDTQKYEKVATIGQSTSRFDEDRAKAEGLINASGGLTQYEQQQGLNGHRTLQLGIGVPPAKFDSFVEDARKIAKVTYLAIVKTDKTNEYRQLRARRETLEKTRKALTEMAASGGSTDERLKVQAQLTDVEEKIQNLGVSLGDFNAENEFCTVKLTLIEAAAVHGLPLPLRAVRAFVWASEHFLILTGAFLMLMLAVWLGALVLGAFARAWIKFTDQ
jgi:uncharacterized protein YfcZ (UPF0381/DUF406 family)